MTRDWDYPRPKEGIMNRKAAAHFKMVKQAEADAAVLEARVLDTVWIREFVRHGMCGLCGNSGMIDTRTSAVSARGVHYGDRFWCICPNGRAIKAADDILKGEAKCGSV